MPNAWWSGALQPAPGSADACATVCNKYFDCKGNTDPGPRAECLAQCQPDTVDPTALASLEAMECDAYVATIEGGGAMPAQPGEQPGEHAGRQAGLAGVWVGEEASLDPSFYMSYTQYVTLWPDGSVSYSKSEGGASRTRIDESFVRFRSWREGQSPPARTVGRWTSDGASVSVQWSIWNNLHSRGRVLSPGQITLSGMGALEEGATLTFKRAQ